MAILDLQGMQTPSGEHAAHSGASKRCNSGLSLLIC
jgi:hypothetical protein